MVRESPLALSLLPSPHDVRALSHMVSTQVLAMRNGHVLERADWLAAEEPLEIRVEGPDQVAVSVAVTMRTPGHDRELAVGFLYTEGLLTCRDALVDTETGHSPGSSLPCNVVTVRLAQPFDAAILQRNFFATSSCGACGKASLQQIAVRCPPVAPGPVLANTILIRLSKRLR